MTVSITRPAKTLSGKIAEAIKRFIPLEQEVKWFPGDSSRTTFSLEAGWKPQFVHVNGLMREGSSEDYTVTYDGFIYSVEFAIAPAAVGVAVIAQRIIK